MTGVMKFPKIWREWTGQTKKRHLQSESGDVFCLFNLNIGLAWVRTVIV